MTALVIAAVVVVIVIVIIVVTVVARGSRRTDGVADFRRQIDALSHEARRPVVGQVQQLEEEAAADAPPPTPPPHDAENEEPT